MDTYGRRFGCIVFCVLEIVINLMEHVPDVTTLFVGRIMGGITTNLLFSAFESWMVAEHRKLGFKESLLASTFAISSWGNGLVAIGAGFIAQWSVTGLNYGDIGPFQVAIALTAVCLMLILVFWGENYGREKPVAAASLEHPATETTCVTETLVSPVPTPKRGRSRTNLSTATPGNSEADLSSLMFTAPSRSVTPAIHESEEADIHMNAANSSPRRTRSRGKLSTSSSGDLSAMDVTTKKPRASRSRASPSIDTDNVDASSRSPSSLPTPPVSSRSSNSNEDRNSDTDTDTGADTDTDHVCTIPDTRHILTIMYHHPEICLLGLSQACFEGAVYTFVFMWVPVLLSVYPSAFPDIPRTELTPLPTGLCFSCFMLSMTLGGMLFSLIISLTSTKVADAAAQTESESGNTTAAVAEDSKLSACDEDSMNLLVVFIYLISACALLLPILSYDFTVIFASFLLLEGMVGMFNASSGTLRSIYYLESHQSSIISVFRIPLNLLVVSGTLLTNSPDIDNQFVFGVLVGLQILAAVLQLSLYAYVRAHRVVAAVDAK